MPADGVGLGAQRVGELLLEREHALGADQHRAARRGRRDLAAGAVEQARAESLLERADGERDGGLRDAEVVGGVENEPRSTTATKRSELARIH